MSKKEKIAILGGGTGALAAAFEITETPDWQERFDITVYQLGWRLGGKGASGRNRDVADRIEEHGLHVWGGFYENAFHIMRRCYAALGRGQDQPLATVWDAFKPKNDVVWEEYVNNKWLHWQVSFPDNHRHPGGGEDPDSLWACLEKALERLVTYIEQNLPGFHTLTSVHLNFPKRLHELIRKWEPSFLRGRASTTKEHHPTHHALSMVLQLVKELPSDPTLHSADTHHGLIWLLRSFRTWFSNHLQSMVSLSDDARRLYIFVDFSLAAMIGMLIDGVLLHGWDIINDENWIDWLKRHGATQLTLESAVVRGFHDYFFAFAEGDPQKPALEAGIAMRQLMRLALTYKGAVFWEMQAGMGDAVFAPIYLVLKQRGVRFKFFHVVENLGLAEDKKTIQQIVVSRQVDLKDPKAEYDPLYDVKGLPCWPSEPLYEQLKQGEKLRAKRVDLECPWSKWKPVEKITLKEGEDFDKVVLGTSLEPLRFIAKELVDANSDWKSMLEQIKSCQTIAAQVWMQPSAKQLGSIPKALMTGYAQLHETWGDFSHLIERENWPEGKTPGNLAYLCGVLPDDAPPFAKFDDHRYPAQQKLRAKEITAQWLRDNTKHLFPNAAPQPTSLPGMDWELLTDLENRNGRYRFNAQYWRANISPQERYVLSVPGSSKYRLDSDQSGFNNLFLAGDWTFTGLGGSIEGATMSGMMAARAITGDPIRIVGEIKRGNTV